MRAGVSEGVSAGVSVGDKNGVNKRSISCCVYSGL